MSRWLRTGTARSFRAWSASLAGVAALVVLVLVGTVGAVVVVTEVMAAQRAQASDADPWAFAAGTLNELTTLAIQSCSAERGAAVDATQADRLRVQQSSIDSRYVTVARQYDRQVRAAVSGGQRRPESVPAGASSLVVAKSRVCLKPGDPLPPVPVRAEDLVFASNVLTEYELDQAALAAGWPLGSGWWDDMKRIVYCESGRNTLAHNRSDPNGGSYGLAQLNGRQHFDKAGEDFELRYDPVVNLRTALWLRTVRGHFGGGGGWSCADKLGIH